MGSNLRQSEPFRLAPVGGMFVVRSLERRLLAIVSIVLSHFLLLIAGAFAAWYLGRRPDSLHAVIPREPLLVLLVALVMAHTTGGAIWWARTSWSPHAKTAAAALACGGLWCFLLLLLDTMKNSGVAAAGWAASLASQILIIVVALIVVELIADYRAAAGRFRFNILYLLLWTSVLAGILGVAAARGRAAGWKLADVPSWEYFAQLQAVAVVNAVLGLAIFLSIRFGKTPIARALMSLIAAAIAAAVGVVSLVTIFGAHVGAATVDLVWIFGGESLFLLATLLPIELVAVHLPPPSAARLAPWCVLKDLSFR